MEITGSISENLTDSDLESKCYFFSSLKTVALQNDAMKRKMFFQFKIITIGDSKIHFY